jgi:hypothetical protein
VLFLARTHTATSPAQASKLNGIERTASTMTSCGKRNPVNADRGGVTRARRRRISSVPWQIENALHWGPGRDLR